MGNDEKSLSRQIAEALGYTVQPVKDYDGTRYAVYMPNRQPLIHYNGVAVIPVTGNSEAVAWRRGCKDYEHSLDAVSDELPRRMIIEFRQLDDGTVLATFCDPDAETSSLWYGEGANRKQAAARALLQWALAQRKDGAE